MIRILALLLALSFAGTAHSAPVDNSDGFWSEWSDATFAKAAREKKFVIMSLQAWWCRWCHVMNRETWADPEVRGILKDKFIPVYVDQDSRPDISQRYERWGWPATIIYEARIRKVLNLMAETMIDKATGAMNQVNLKPDWSEPAREFPMFAQE